MKIIYETRGRAREYFELSANLYLGMCQHACRYCYAPDILRTKANDFAHPAPDVINRIAHDAEELERKGELRYILLCFLTDPYQPCEEVNGITRQVISILKAHRLRVAILTKAGELPRRDFDLLTPLDQYGATLTMTDLEKQRRWEPGAPPFAARIATLLEAKKRGIPTFVSLEPVIYPEDTLEIIQLVYPYVDSFKVGKLNYVKHEVDWRQFAERVVQTLNRVGATYYIKKDLAKYLGKKEGFWSREI